MVEEVPVILLVVAVTVVAVAAVVWVVRVMVAIPLPLVSEVPAEKDPLESDLVQVTV